MPRALILSLATIVIISLLSYGPAIERFFTGSDAFALIYSAQIHSLPDLFHVISSPLMDGTSATKVSLYYRPLSALSYSLDYAIWDLNPLGYHLTNLLLHIASSIALFLLMRRINGPRNEFATLIGIVLFLLHPILLQSVPVIANRQDVLVTFFIAISLILVHRLLFEARSSMARVGFLAICALCAISAKELGVVLIPLTLLFAVHYGITTPNRYSRKRIATVTLAVSLPIILFLLLRLHVLGGIGGFERPLTLETLLLINRQFWKALTYPMEVQFLPKQYELVLYGAVLVALILQLKACAFDHGKRIRIIQLLLYLNIFLFSSLLLMEYKLDKPLLSLLEKSADLSISPSSLAATKDKLAKAYILGLSVLGVIVLAIMIAKSRLISSERKALYAFYGIWLILPLAIYLLSTPAGNVYRLLYFPLAAYCMLLALFLQDYYQLVSQGEVVTGNAYRRLSLIFSGAILAGTLGTQVGFSPLFNRYDELYTSTAVIESILQEISKAADDAPPHSHIALPSVPICILSEKRKNLVMLTNQYLAPYGHTIQSWLDLNYPAKQLTSSIGKGVAWRTFSPPISSSVKVNDKQIIVNFVGPEKLPWSSDCVRS
jgi:hypothetical protein